MYLMYPPLTVSLWLSIMHDDGASLKRLPKSSDTFITHSPKFDAGISPAVPFASRFSNASLLLRGRFEPYDSIAPTGPRVKRNRPRRRACFFSTSALSTSALRYLKVFQSHTMFLLYPQKSVYLHTNIHYDMIPKDL